jgi:UDP-N-acetylmuramoylalanine--D-glutamate ligase
MAERNAVLPVTEIVKRYDAVIIGLGRTGLSCVRFLSRQGASIAVVDSRDHPPELDSFRREYPSVPLMLGDFDADLLGSTGQLIISPGVSAAHPAIQNAVKLGAELVGDIELFARHARAPVVAVTGSNGKSTVAALIAAMINDTGLHAALGGNFGTPALSFLETAEPDYYVLELSSFQLETVKSLNAAVSVVLNISPDHMDRYAGIKDYASAKERIYLGDGCMVVNKDDDFVAAMARPGRNTIRFSLNQPLPGEFGISQHQGSDWLSRGAQRLLPCSALRIKGRHNMANALAALALGEAIGLPLASMSDSLKKFGGLPHRCEWVADINGVSWINDSKGTNIGATIAAIEGLAGAGDTVLIAGGDGKGADFTPLAQTVPARVHAVVLIGRDAGRIAAAIQGHTNIYYATGMQAAVETAARLARPGDKVLLSPACASLDMFKDYQERGRRFAEAVRGLKQGVRDV